MKINIQTKGALAAAGLMEKASDGLSGACATGMAEGLSRMMDDAIGLVHVRTGQLRNSLAVRVEPSDNGATGSLTANTEYALYVEMGTGAKGAASAGSGEALKKPTTGGEYTLDHGGMEAQPYLYPAYQANKDLLSECVSEAIMEALGG